jgi:hypothetical protein
MPLARGRHVFRLCGVSRTLLRCSSAGKAKNVSRLIGSGAHAARSYSPPAHQNLRGANDVHAVVRRVRRKQQHAEEREPPRQRRLQSRFGEPDVPAPPASLKTRALTIRSAPPLVKTSSEPRPLAHRRDDVGEGECLPVSDGEGKRWIAEIHARRNRPPITDGSREISPVAASQDSLTLKKPRLNSNSALRPCFASG